MIKARILPLAFKNINAREKEEFNAQLKVLGELYGDVAEFMSPLVVGSDISDEVDAVVFPQLVGEAFSEKAALSKISLPVLVITSQFGTVEMWDWEIVTFLRDAGLTVFSPYTAMTIPMWSRPIVFWAFIITHQVGTQGRRNI